MVLGEDAFGDAVEQGGLAGRVPVEDRRVAAEGGREVAPSRSMIARAAAMTASSSRRGSAARRGLRQSRRETAAASQQRDDLIDEREAVRAQTDSAQHDAAPVGNGHLRPDDGQQDDAELPFTRQPGKSPVARHAGALTGPASPEAICRRPWRSQLEVGRCPSCRGPALAPSAGCYWGPAWPGSRAFLSHRGYWP